MRGELPLRAEFVVFYRLRVRWSEVDAQGIVFNPNYLAYADLALTEYLRALGLPYTECMKLYGMDWLAARSEVDFVGSALFDDELELAARVEYIGMTSFRMRVGIFRGEEVLTQIRTTYVNASLTEKKPLPLPAGFIARLEAHERTPPLRK
ncbi:MAG: 4-hydroxybenzoyl-CoA thioesterase [Myxococcaceae bacterium]|nr:4-hydroxybenzoyl-CoA thioesterase [Myxococcaceae bacterium]